MIIITGSQFQVIFFKPLQFILEFTQLDIQVFYGKFQLFHILIIGVTLFLFFNGCISKLSSFFVLENTQLFYSLIHEVDVFGMVQVGSCGPFHNLLQLISHFLVLFTQGSDNILLFLHLINNVCNFPFVFWNEQLLRFYLFSEHVLDLLISVFIQDQFSEDLFILVIPLLVKLE